MTQEKVTEKETAILIRLSSDHTVGITDYDGEDHLYIQANDGDAVVIATSDFEVLMVCYEQLLMRLASQGLKN